MSDKLTDWFPGDVKPVREGWYEREWDNRPTHQKSYSNDYWDGTEWWMGNYSGHKVGRTKSDLRWRGLANKP